MPSYGCRKNGNSGERYSRPEFDERTGRIIYSLSNAPHNSKREIYLRLEEGGQVYRARMIRGTPIFNGSFPSKRVGRKVSGLED